MRLFKSRRRTKAKSGFERKNQSNEDLYGSIDYEEFQRHRLPAGGPPCSCQACKLNLPSCDRPIQLERHPTVINSLNYGFTTATVGTQTDFTHDMSIQTESDLDSQYEADDYSEKSLEKSQHMASQTDSPRKPEKTQHMSSQTYPKKDTYSNDIKNEQYRAPRKRQKPKTIKSNTSLQKEESKQRIEKQKYSQNESIWRRPTIVVHSHKALQHEKVKFLKDYKVIEPDEDDDEESPPDSSLGSQQDKSSNCPNCDKADELSIRVFHLTQELEKQEYQIYKLQDAVNTLKEQGVREVKDKDTETFIQKGEESAFIQPELLSKSVLAQPEVNEGATCQCETLYEQFMRIFTKPEGNQQSKDLISTSGEARSRQFIDNNCPKAKTYNLDNLFREFMRLFMKPTEPESEVCDDSRKILTCIPLEPTQTVSNCISLTAPIQKLEIPERDTNCCITSTKTNKLDSTKRTSNKIMATTPTLIPTCQVSDLKLTKLDECPCPSSQMSTNNLASNSLLQRQQSSLCQFCRHKNLPIQDDLINELIKIIGKRCFKDVVLTVLLRADNVYHVNVREIETGHVLGCLLVNDRAIDDAIASGLFENIITYCVIDVRSTIKPKVRPFGIPFEFIHDDSFKDRQREQGGENDNLVQREAKIWEFAVKVLGLPMEYKERMFLLINAVKLTKQRSHYQLRITSKSLKRR